jgi:hypothetical protein
MTKRLVLVLVGSLALLGCFEDITDPLPQGSTGTTQTSGADGSTGEAEVCPEYCTLVQDVCETELAQYTSTAICEAVCEAMPPGTPEDQFTNSAACRRFQAIQASEDPTTFCGAAGPTGGGVCGAQCESFCSLATTLCTGDNEQWPDAPACIADCMQLSMDVDYHAAVVSGDSYACRTYHLTVAALDPEVHCPHIGPVSATCV